MNKAKFLSALNERLSILDAKEREDILHEYADHIDSKVADGLTEEEAIAGFGDFDELVADLLSAYHVNPTYDRDTGSRWQQVSDFFQDAFDGLLHLNASQAFELFVKFIIYLVVVFVFYGCISIIAHFFKEMISAPIPYSYEGLRDGIDHLFDLAVSIIGSIFGLYIMYYFIKNYVIRSERLRVQASSQNGKRTVGGGEIHMDRRIKDEKQNKKEHDIPIRLVWMVLVAVLFLIVFVPMLGTFIATLIATIAAIGLSVMGYPLIGIALSGVGLVFIFFVILILMGKFLFEKKL